MFKKYCFHIATAAFLTLSSGAFGLASAQDVSGTVLETMNSGGYTYMHVDSGMGQEWVAVPETTIHKGDSVTYSQGMVMNNFHSKTLDRTFPSIIFSGGIVATDHGAAQQVSTETSAPAAEDSFAAAVAREQQAHSAAQAESVIMETSGGSTGAIVPFSEISVEKATGENGYTVEELFTESKDLNGKTIQVRGKVVKFSPMIMGKNWAHIQDGTGNPMKNSHDLVVTTQESVAVDDIVLFEGVLASEKDFGAGYKYETIIEEAKIIK